MFSPQMQNSGYLHEVMEVFTNLIMVIISQYMHGSHHRIVHLKLTVLSAKYISVKLGKKEG